MNDKIRRQQAKQAKGYRAAWFKKHCPGKTFADVGGLWGIEAETVSLAMKHGASEGTLIDAWAGDAEADLMWDRLRALWKRKNVEGKCVVADLEADWYPTVAGTYDNVFCCGVLYHVPNILNVVKNLASSAKERLFIVTQTIPNNFENSAGKLVVPDSQALFVPSLTEQQKKILKVYYDSHKYDVSHINSKLPLGYDPFIKPDGSFNYGPSWWLPTRGWLMRILNMFGMHVEATNIRTDHATQFVCKRK